MGLVLWGAFLVGGATGARFWQALLLAVLAAAVLTTIGAVGMRNDPLCSQMDCSITVASFAYNFAMKLTICMLFYGMGRGGAAIANRLRRKKDSTEQV